MQMTDQTSLLYIFGLGYSGITLAEQAIAAGWRVMGTVRCEDKASALRAHGFDSVVWQGEAGLDIPDGAHWVVTVPPDELGCPVARATSPSEARAASVTYLSTTGVYGDRAGGWVFECSAVSPSSDRARRRVKAEQQWLDKTEQKARLVRLPGIYGPDRSALDRVAAGRARRVIKAGQVFSRVHVEDIARGLLALIEWPELTGVFHLCDDVPAPPQDVIAYAAELLGVPVPPDIDFETADMSQMARSFYADCKRVSNARTKAALNWQPRYASYREGLTAIRAEAPS